MADCNNADTKWSEKKKKMDGDQDAKRTVECLRGRLLAERSASRSAKENADLMAEKLRQLEEKLKAEVKARNKAEKKLNLLKKKLETLSISYLLEDSADHQSSSSSSENCASSCISSAEPEEGQKFQGSDSCVEGHERPSIENPFTQKSADSMGLTVTQDPCDETLKSEDKSGDSGTWSLSIVAPSHQGLELCEKSTDSQVYDSGENSIQISKQPHQQYCHQTYMVSSTIEETTAKDEENSEKNQEEEVLVDESMALVTPMACLELLARTKVKIANQSAREVLDTLRQLRELLLQPSSESKHFIIKVDSN